METLSLRIVNLQAEIRSRRIPNVNQNRYRTYQILGDAVSTLRDVLRVFASLGS
jgi:hypothetical protein